MDAPYPISILVVDDHPVVREGISAILSFEADMNVVGQVDNGDDGVDAFLRLQPDVVLMDLRMPGIGGTEAIQRICGHSRSAQVIVLTSVGGDADISRALEAGARGYLFKDMVRTELVKAIRAVVSGQRYIPARVGAKLAEGLPRPELSAREIEVLQFIAAGLRNKEVAFQMEISEETVKAHVKRILEKLDVNDRTHAVTTALRRGIISL